jgi:hypothetical protein
MLLSDAEPGSIRFSYWPLRPECREASSERWHGMPWISFAGRSLCDVRSGRIARAGLFIKGTKSGRERTIFLRVLAIATLKSHRASQAAEKLLKGEEYDDPGFVFADELDRLLNLDSVSKGFTALVRAIGIKK